MKDIVKKSLALFIIAVLVLINNSIVFAFDSDIAEQENDDIITNIAEPAEVEEEEDIDVPSFIMDAGVDDPNEESLDILASGTKEDPEIISSASDFDYGTLEDGTIAITGLKKTPSNYYKINIPSKIDGKAVSTIYYYAFEYKYDLVGVTLPSSVTNIYDNAFYYAYNLKSINLENVVNIGSFAFGKTGIETINLGKNAKGVTGKSFADANNISAINVDSNNPNFSSTDGILYNKDKTALVSYPHKKTNASYVMPNSVKIVNESACYQVTALESVTLSSNLEEIKAYAFSGCTNLKNNITLGSKMKKLEQYSLAGTAIESITIPASVTELASGTFLNCSKLTSINVATNNSNYSSVDGVVFSKDKTKLLIYPSGRTNTSYSIPNGTKVLGESSLQYAKFSSVTIPASVTTFEDWCFACCENLTSVTVPATVTTIKYGTFSQCTNLKSVVYNSSCDLTYLMFSQCKNLTSVKLNNNIKIIANRAFYYCSGLTSITLPTNLDQIWVAAFMGCSKLANVSIPANVTYIQSGAFDNTTKFDVSKTKLTKLDNGDYRIISEVYINGTFDYKKAYECLNLLNAKRKEQGLSEVKMDKDILNAAMTRAAEIALLFEHSRPNGTSYYTLNSNKISSENIAAGSSTASGAINQWMNSTMGHKENMLSGSWKAVGIGCFTTSDGLTYWVQNFGSVNPSEQSTAPANSTKEVKIQTTKSNVESIYWKDKNSNVELNIGDSITKEIRCTNKGWEYASVILLNKSFNWKSSNTNVATVDSNGKVVAKGAGSAQITASVKGYDISLTLNVKVNDKLPFTDVKTSDWFYNAVNYTYNNKIISGYNTTTFAPNDKLTRGMIVTILYRMEGSPNNDGKSKFSDVSTSEWYAKAVKWAADNGIVHGYGGTNNFGPNDNIIRQDLAAILKNYAGYKKKDISIAGSLAGFSDEYKVDSYAYRAMQWAVGTGVITGNADKTLNPKGNATRAEAAAMIQKYCNKVGR